MNRWPSIAAATLILAVVVAPVASASPRAVAGTPGQVLAQIPTGPNPQDVVVSPDNRFAYVTTLDDGVVTEIDLASFQATRSLDIGVTAGAVIWRAGELVVADAATGALVIVDPATFQERSAISNTTDAIALSSSPDGLITVYSSAAGGGVGVIDDGRQYSRAVAVGGTPWGIDLFADGTRFLVTDTTNGRAVLGTTGTEVLDPEILGSVAVGGRPSYVAVAPDESVAYVSNADTGAIDVIDLATLAHVASYAVGGRPWGIAVSWDNRYLYVPDNKNGAVVSVNAATGAVLSTVATGTRPDFVAVSPDGTLVLVPNSDSNTLTVMQGYSQPPGTADADSPGTGSAESGDDASAGAEAASAAAFDATPVIIGVSLGAVALAIAVAVVVLAQRRSPRSAVAGVAPPAPAGTPYPRPGAVIPPNATPAELAALATDPASRAAVAAHPNAYPDLLDWLAQRGDPEVDAALRARGR